MQELALVVEMRLLSVSAGNNSIVVGWAVSLLVQFQKFTVRVSLWCWCWTFTQLGTELGE